MKSIVLAILISVAAFSGVLGQDVVTTNGEAAAGGARPAVIESQTAGDPAILEWVERLRGLQGHEKAHFVTGFRVGPELVQTDPDFGLKVVQAVWDDLADVQVKRGLLKAFHLSKALRPALKHEHAITLMSALPVVAGEAEAAGNRQPNGIELR